MCLPGGETEAQDLPKVTQRMESGPEVQEPQSLGPRGSQLCQGLSGVDGTSLPEQGAALDPSLLGFAMPPPPRASDVAFSKTQNEWKHILFGESCYTPH